MASKYVQFKQRGSKVWLSFYKIGMAKNDKEAIATAKKRFVRDWNFGRKDGLKTVKKMVFQIYKP